MISKQIISTLMLVAASFLGSSCNLDGNSPIDMGPVDYCYTVTSDPEQTIYSGHEKCGYTNQSTAEQEARTYQKRCVENGFFGCKGTTYKQQNGRRQEVFSNSSVTGTHYSDE